MICRALASSKLGRTITRHPVATKFGLCTSCSLPRISLPMVFHTTIEPALHCGNHTLFPDFLAETGFGRVLIEFSGFRAPQTWIRLLEKLKLYLSCKAADRILVVHLEQYRETALKITRQLSSLIRTISISDMRHLLRSVASSKDSSGNIRIVSLGEALQVCRRMNGKRFHWYRLIQTLPKDQWVDMLVRRGFSRAEIEKVRIKSDLTKRLIEAIRLADSHQIVPREAMIEMMAGVYQAPYVTTSVQ